MSKHEQQEYSVGIVGYGFVGRAVHHLFPQACVYDINPELSKNTQAEVNDCQIVFICVPTDGREDGSVDLSAVDSVFEWLSGPIAVIKSTVPPKSYWGFCEKYASPIIFNPEFLTERNWKFDVENENRVILGGIDNWALKQVARLYQKVYGQNVAYIYTTPDMAMLTKYVNNAFLATKVTFCNQVYDICEVLGVDYDELREIWLLDERIGRSHTLVTDKRGFGGYCLPKDLAGLIKTAQSVGLEPAVLKAVEDYNNKVRSNLTPSKIKG